MNKELYTSLDNLDMNVILLPIHTLEGISAFSVNTVYNVWARRVVSLKSGCVRQS